MIAFYGESNLKSAVMKRLGEHLRADHFVQGTYWEKGRGCQIGCLVHSGIGVHDQVEEMFGIESRVVYWLESVFEHVDKSECGHWAHDSIDCIPVGADLSLCHHHLFSRLLSDEFILLETLLKYDIVQSIAGMHREAMTGRVFPESEWKLAFKTARLVSHGITEKTTGSDWEALRNMVTGCGWSARSCQTINPLGVLTNQSTLSHAITDLAKASHRPFVWNRIAKETMKILSSAPVDGPQTDDYSKQVNSSLNHLQFVL